MMLACAGACSTAPDPPLPIGPGEYEFTHRFAEHPSMASIRVIVRIDGRQIVVVNPAAADPFPAGVMDEGTLMWHAGSGQWIIGRRASDRSLRDVGGCSGGPEVIDLANKVYWTC
jgi:hypothetical protein